MKVTTRISWDIDGNVVEHEWFEYSGQVAECKGGDAAAAEQKRTNDIQDAELKRQNELFDKIKSATSRYTDGSGEGFDPVLKQQMISQFMGQGADRFNDAGSMVRGALASRGSGGGDAPPSGDYVRGVAGLASDRARNLSGGIANINMQDLQQALTNKFNSMSLLSGNAATLNGPIGTLGEQSANAVKQYVAAQNSGWMNDFMGGIGKGIGSGLGSGLSGGFGKMFGSNSGSNGNGQ